jgi:hypothetical protein
METLTFTAWTLDSGPSSEELDRPTVPCLPNRPGEYDSNSRVVPRGI